MLLFGPPQPSSFGTSDTWAARTDIPDEANPSGALWLVEKEWTFDGPEGAPPPAPWHTGIEWAGAHPVLGGHVWRDQVNLDNQAYLDGAGSLVLKLDWDATHETAVGAYLITDKDGDIVRPDDYRVNPIGENGVFIEFEVTLPETQPQASWAAAWTYATVDDTPLHSSLAGQPWLVEEIDLFEKIGVARPYYQERFHTNTHGRQPGLLSDCAQDEGLAVGEGFPPVTEWGGAPPNDGSPHKWAIMWTPDPDGEQIFFYDGHAYATRPKGDDTVHSKPHGLRLSWETAYPNPFGAAVEPSTETAYFPREMKVHNVRVLRRRLPTPIPAGDKPNTLIGAAGLGLALVFQDQFHVQDPPNLAADLWNYRPSARNAAIAAPSTDVTNTQVMTTVTVGGKPARRVHEFRMPKGVWWGWTNSAEPDSVGGTKGAVAVDVFVPSDYRYEAKNGRRDGKTAIGIWIAPAGVATWNYHKGEGGSTYPWQQAIGNGGVSVRSGLNFSSYSNGDPYFTLYTHVLGYNGIASKRSQTPPTGAAGLIHPTLGWDLKIPIPRGRWITVEKFVQVDTNGKNGILSVWTTDNGVTTRWIHLTDLDFGGMTGTRNYATMPRQDNFTWGTTPQSLNITLPSKVRGFFSRHMPGGWPGGDSQAERDNFWNLYTTGRWYMYNWRYWQG